MKFSIFAMALLAAVPAFAAAPKAPEPAKPVEAATFFAGRWYEFARTPKSFNAGCVAGVTDYQPKDGGITERDACHEKTPDGKEDSIGGPLKILNPGANTKVDVAYRALGGLFPIHREYWVLDHGDDWFMIANPEMTEVNLYSREPRPGTGADGQDDQADQGSRLCRSAGIPRAFGGKTVKVPSLPDKSRALGLKCRAKA